MKKLTFLLRSEITDADVLDNICDDTTAIYIDEDNCWIESSSDGFFIPNGWGGFRTDDIIEAKTALIKFKIDNNIPIF
jgi:hypothetical protein